MRIKYEEAPEPASDDNEYVPVDLSEETMKEHREKTYAAMDRNGIDALVVYGDREHGSNFAYLTGFEPRFEEGAVILFRDGGSSLLLGNENLKMAEYSFIKGDLVHVPYFSLPNQPMGDYPDFNSLMRQAGIRDNMKIGCVGWKMFSGKNRKDFFDIPAFIVNALSECNPCGELENVSEIFLDPQDGLRSTVNANELAHYEFGAGLASAKMLEALDEIAPGKTEMEIADILSGKGQPVTVTTICAAGDRFTNAVVFPRNKPICLGDKMSMTLGFRGGLSSRAAYIAETEEDLPENVRDYVERVAIPYFRAAVSWYEQVGPGTLGKDIYRMIEERLPKNSFGWTLNPGHLTGADEWVSSPFYPGSEVELKSGMMLQMDIIPSVPGYGGVSAEDGVVIADRKLQKEVMEQYPEVWSRLLRRKQYMEEVLGIRLREEVFPLSDICGYYRPLLLNRKKILKNS